MFGCTGAVGLFADITNVDFVGIPLGLELQTMSNGSQSVLGMPSNPTSQVCSLLRAGIDEDGQPWSNLCIVNASGQSLLVISLSALIANQSSAFNDY